MLHISVSPKYQVTIVEDVRKHFPQIVPGSKVEVAYDERLQAITIKPAKQLEDLVATLKPKRKGARDFDEIRKSTYARLAKDLKDHE